MSDTSSACGKMSPSNDNIPEWVQALEPVRNLAANAGSMIRKCVYDALEKGAPAWAKKKLLHSVNEEMCNPNASVHTKSVILSMLADVSETRKEHKISVPDITLKLCRITLRNFATLLDSFCNSLPLDHMASTKGMFDKFDFWSIDCKLAAGAYGESHEAFFHDVQEIWTKVRVANAEKPNVVKLADSICQHFKLTYEKEVLGPVRKLKEYSGSNSVNKRNVMEVRNMLNLTSSIPKAPWNSGVCEVCHIEKHLDLVLSCDICGGEYHTYCLATPLERIPEGNWYCPLCISNISQLPGICQIEKYEEQVECIGSTSAVLEGEKSLETSEDEGVICEVCGDIGYRHAIISCYACKTSSVHRYCALDDSEIFSASVMWACGNCVSLDLKKHLSWKAPQKSAEQVSVSIEQRRTHSSDYPDRELKFQQETSFEGRGQKRKMKAKEVQTDADLSKKMGASYVPMRPIPEPIWKGSLTTVTYYRNEVKGAALHLSIKASPKMGEELSSLPTLLPVEVLPRMDIWPPRFKGLKPDVRDIVIYLLPQKGKSGTDFGYFIEEMITRDLAIRSVVEDAEFLIFTSVQLPLELWRFKKKRYLWGFRTAKKNE